MKYILLFILVINLPSIALSAVNPLFNPSQETNQQPFPAHRIDLLMESSIRKALISGGPALCRGRVDDLTLYAFYRIIATQLGEILVKRPCVALEARRIYVGQVIGE